MVENIWYKFYNAMIKLGIMRFDYWDEDAGSGMRMLCVEPRWFWQRRRGS